jgi:DNA-binding MarR family transcriptional regulator
MTDLVDSILGDWEKERPDTDWSPLEVVVRVQLLAKRLSRDAGRALARHDLKLWEYDVLSALRRLGAPFELMASELARSSMLTSGTITTRIDGLEEKGYVTRSPNANDRRAVRVRLTPKGARTIDAAIRTRLELAGEQLAVLPVAEQQAVADALRKLMPASGTT